jgi:hypothetical protein
MRRCSFECAALPFLVSFVVARDPYERTRKEGKDVKERKESKEGRKEARSIKEGGGSCRKLKEGRNELEGRKD